MKRLNRRTPRRVIAAALALALVLAWPAIRFRRYPLGFCDTLYYRMFVAGYGMYSRPEAQTVFRELRGEYREIQAIRSYVRFGDLCVGVSMNTDNREIVDRVAAGVQERLASEPLFSEYLESQKGCSTARINFMIHQDYGRKQLYCSSMFCYTDFHYWLTGQTRSEEGSSWDSRYPDGSEDSEQFFREHFA